MGAAANPNMSMAVPQGGVAPTTPGAYQRASMANLGALSTYANPGAAAANMMNPYENQVVQQTLRDVGQQALKAQNVLGAQAQSAGAFGGSRHGIAEAEMAKNYTQQMADQAARMRQTGYNQAMGNAFTAAQGLQGAGQQAFNMGQAINQQQMQQGAMQQAAMQSLIDAAKNQYQGYTRAPQAGLAAMFGGAGLTEGTKGSSSTFQPGLMDYLTTAASTFYGMGR